MNTTRQDQMPSAGAAGSAVRKPVVHFLKTLPQYLDAVAARQKPFEVRRDDRDFQVGDWLTLGEWHEELGELGSRWIDCKITYVLRGADAVRFGVRDGYCVLGILLSASHQWPPNSAHAEKYVIEADGRMRVEWPSPNIQA